MRGQELWPAAVSRALLLFLAASLYYERTVCVQRMVPVK